MERVCLDGDNAVYSSTTIDQGDGLNRSPLLHSHDCGNKHPSKVGREIPKLCVAVLFTTVSAFLNFFLLVIVHDITPKTEALPDLMFMYV